MPYVAGDMLRITTVMSAGVGKTIENVFIVSSGAGAGQDEQDVMADMEEWFTEIYTSLQNYVPTNLVHVEIRGFNITRDQPMPTQVWTMAAGAQIGDPLPEGVCGLVLFRTDRARCIGRKFLGPFCEPHNTAGTVHVDVLNAELAFAVSLMGDWVGTATGLTFTYYIRDKLGALHRPLEAVISNIWAYQRRRRPGRGV
jgi:hypothetical protein